MTMSVKTLYEYLKKYKYLLSDLERKDMKMCAQQCVFITIS